MQENPIQPTAAISTSRSDVDEFATLIEEKLARAKIDAVEYRFGFRVGSLYLLHDASEVVEIVPLQKISPVPNVPGWLKGLVNLRGNLIPVFDLKTYLLDGQNVTSTENHNLREENDKTAEQRLLVFGEGQRAAAMFINGLPVQLRFSTEIKQLDETDFPDQLREFSRGAFEINDQIWVQVDFDQLFTFLGDRISQSVS